MLWRAAEGVHRMDSMNCVAEHDSSPIRRSLPSGSILANEYAPLSSLGSEDKIRGGPEVYHLDDIYTFALTKHLSRYVLQYLGREHNLECCLPPFVSFHTFSAPD